MEAVKTPWDEFEKAFRQLERETDAIYIYGCGTYGNNVYKMLERRGLHVSGFVVTTGADTQKANLPIVNADVALCDNIGLILALNPHNSRKVKEYLRERHFDAEKILDGGQYMDRSDNREDRDDIPTIEVTTKIGCSVACRFCPQQLLVSKYFQDAPRRESQMTLETFERCLSNLPDVCRISFCGMAEPFLNPDCLKMVEKACASGRDVEVFTTLVGASADDVAQLVKLPVGFVCLHIPDQQQYAKIPVDDEYLNKLRIITAAKKADGTPFVNVCSSQGEPLEKIWGMLSSLYEVGTSLQNRAGNLDDESLTSRKTPEGKIYCTFCGQQLNRNVLLPDGTVLLCCMDYGMKHVLGNLRDVSYDAITNGAQANRIRLGMTSDYSLDILCRTCAQANLCI